jgi:hypothetical protein
MIRALATRVLVIAVAIGAGYVVGVAIAIIAAGGQR